jgi:hypothetical protein
MRSGGIWLTAFVRGCKLEALTDFSRGTTPTISYIQCCMLVRFWSTNFQLISKLIIKYFKRWINIKK